ncbi:Histone acetyltransferase GCN5 [Gracilariopsis chorda]|uniref:Histone acetyltransferase GCN5 n=1 Tax=Gracilariopsis chorda TaxID=448386 RepID=A0A2V3IKH9_9FLOR|nr:Histone acetyltransferase GCN5 [Gracilariopsis chorda]|eukprot:PXF42604.1 Histone acetyltransferase GCN5 [Gracilariopsis chorda]
MSSAYVTRLLFDPNHESFIVVKKTLGEYEVVDGCCYRSFLERRFTEIAFLAVWGTQQVRGYGARLMDYNKERVNQPRLTHVLTCTDNNAVPYFAKQGFNTEISLPQHRWHSYVKAYDGVTLMECVLLSQFNYLNVPMLLKAQTMGVVENLKQVSASHIVHPGLDGRSKKGICVRDIAGLRHQAGFERHQRRNSEQERAEKHVHHAHLQRVLEELKKHECVWPFLCPVDTEDTGAND